MVGIGGLQTSQACAGGKPRRIGETYTATSGGEKRGHLVEGEALRGGLPVHRKRVGGATRKINKNPRPAALIENEERREHSTWTHRPKIRGDRRKVSRGKENTHGRGEKEQTSKWRGRGSAGRGKGSQPGEREKGGFLTAKGIGGYGEKRTLCGRRKVRGDLGSSSGLQWEKKGISRKTVARERNWKNDGYDASRKKKAIQNGLRLGAKRRRTALVGVDERISHFSKRKTVKLLLKNGNNGAKKKALITENNGSVVGDPVSRG